MKKLILIVLLIIVSYFTYKQIKKVNNYSKPAPEVLMCTEANGI